MKLRSLLLAGTVAVAGTAASAGGHCSNDVPLSSLTNAFPAYETMTEAMAACGNFTAELDKDHRLKLQDAMAADPALYALASSTNSTSVPLFDEGLVRPLDDLIAEFGQSLNPNQFIKVDGKTMAIAAFVNTQHLMYREDIFADLGLDVPTTWDEVLSAAEAIQAAGVVDYPYSSYYKSDWNLGFVFVNHYLGEGGAFVDADLMPAIDRDKATVVLERMKALAGYMDPEYLVADSTFVTKQLQQGKVAMANLWASRAGAVNDPAESQHAGAIKMASAIAGGETLSATLWWDGWVIASNISDEEAEAAFKLIVAAMDESVISANNDDAIWLAPGFTPGDAAVGAIATAQTGAPNYPSSREITIMHTALANGLSAYMTGDKDIESTLSDIEAEYVTAAKEAGLIN